MKSLAKKFMSIILVLILIISATVLTGCYYVRSGTVKQIQGTYILTHYSNDGDLMTEQEMLLFLVLDGSGGGYYAYRDNDTESFIAELRYNLEADPEESGKYSYINIDFGNGDDPHHMAVNADLTSCKFNSQQPVWRGNLFDGTLQIDHYINVNFERVSRKTDLSYVLEEFGEAKQFEFGTKRVGGTYNTFDSNLQSAPNDYSTEKYSSPFVYFYINIDMMRSEATAYYALKTGEPSVEQVKKTFPITVGNNGSISISLDGVDASTKFDDNSASFFIPFEMTLDNEGEPSRTVTVYIPFYRDGDMTEDAIMEVIEQDIARYQESLPTEPPADGANDAPDVEE